MRVLASILLVLTVLPPPALGQMDLSIEGTTYVAMNNAPVLHEPRGDQAFTLSRGDTVKVVENEGFYYRVRYKDRGGWMRSSSLMTNSDKERFGYTDGPHLGDSVLVTGGRLAKKTRPPLNPSEKVADLSRGDTVKVVGKRMSFYKVVHDGQKGWIMDLYFMTEEEEREYDKELKAGDITLTAGGDVMNEPGYRGDQIGIVEWGDTLSITGREDGFLEIRFEEQNGWVDTSSVMTHGEKKAYLQGPDTVVVSDGDVMERPSIASIEEYSLSRGDTLQVFGRRENLGETYLRVVRDGQVGWLSQKHVMDAEQRSQYERYLEAKERYLKAMEEAKEKGYTIFLTGHSFEKNSADGIAVGLGVTNISSSKTVKYLDITWKLFDPVGEPTPGDNSGSSTTQARIVGPIKPEDSGYTEIENVWYSSTGSCAEIHRIEAQHIDGSTFIYVNDLQDIGSETRSVNLQGDCNYQAQQLRRRRE